MGFWLGKLNLLINLWLETRFSCYLSTLRQNIVHFHATSSTFMFPPYIWALYLYSGRQYIRGNLYVWDYLNIRVFILKYSGHNFGTGCPELACPEFNRLVLNIKCPEYMTVANIRSLEIKYLIYQLTIRSPGSNRVRQY